MDISATLTKLMTTSGSSKWSGVPDNAGQNGSVANIGTGWVAQQTAWTADAQQTMPYAAQNKADMPHWTVDKQDSGNAWSPQPACQGYGMMEFGYNAANTSSMYEKGESYFYPPLNIRSLLFNRFELKDEAEKLNAFVPFLSDFKKTLAAADVQKGQPTSVVNTSQEATSPLKKVQADLSYDRPFLSTDENRDADETQKAEDLNDLDPIASQMVGVVPFFQTEQNLAASADKKGMDTSISGKSAAPAAPAVGAQASAPLFRASASETNPNVVSSRFAFSAVQGVIKFFDFLFNATQQTGIPYTGQAAYTLNELQWLENFGNTFGFNPSQVEALGVLSEFFNVFSLSTGTDEAKITRESVNAVTDKIAQSMNNVQVQDLKSIVPALDTLLHSNVDANALIHSSKRDRAIRFNVMGTGAYQAWNLSR